jgi:hypothetical protein
LCAGEKINFQVFSEKAAELRLSLSAQAGTGSDAVKQRLDDFLHGEESRRRLREQAAHEERERRAREAAAEVPDPD